jgi:hypothetical protein
MEVARLDGQAFAVVDGHVIGEVGPRTGSVSEKTIQMRGFAESASTSWEMMRKPCAE